MTLAFGSVGASATGNGTGTTAPTAPSGISAGNTLILVLTVSTLGSTGAAVSPTTPSGWTPLGNGKNESTTVGDQIFVYGKIAVGGDTMPTQTWTPTTKWTNQVYRYTGAGGSGLPTAFFGPGQTNSSSTSNVCSIGGTATSQWVSYIFSERSSTNTSWGSTITGLTQRGSGFGSGGGAVDIGLYDTNGAISGTIPTRTAVAGTVATWGENAILVWPSDGTIWTDSETDLTNPTDSTAVDFSAVVTNGRVVVTDRGFTGSGSTGTAPAFSSGTFTPAAGTVLTALVYETDASGTPSLGTLTDNFGDSGGVGWSVQASQVSTTTDIVLIATRKIGTGAGSGHVTYTTATTSSMLKTVGLEVAELAGASSAFALHTGQGQGSVANLGSQPAPGSIVLSVFMSSTGLTETPPTGFTMLDTRILVWTGASAYMNGGAPASSTWPNSSISHCATAIIEIGAVVNTADNVGLTDSVSAVLTHAFVGWGTPL